VSEGLSKTVDTTCRTPNKHTEDEINISKLNADINELK